MNTEWEIQKRSSQCLNCARPFADEDLLHCVLKMEELQPVRRDYCQICWEQVKGTPEPATPFSYWQSRYRVETPPPKVEPVKRDLVEVLLKKYLSCENLTPDQINFCYILAVMLERKKLLSQKDSLADPSGKKRLVYEHNKTGETLVIVDPQLKLAEIPVVQQQVKALLDAELAVKT